ncbi:SDR family NAD(P)-dependent oxidoreductase [Lachnospiraceae bacterium KK002]
MLQGKNAIITGARRGIGRAAVEIFAKYGANIWACARKKDNNFEQDMAQIAKAHGISIWPTYFELTNGDEIKDSVQDIKRERLPVHVLVNSAGIAEESSIFTMASMEKMHHVFEVNFFGMTLLTQYVSRLMIRQGGGSIVNIASVAGIDGRPAQYEYAGSKAAVIGGVRQLARELGSYNIRVNAVAPGIVDTDMGEQISEKLKDEVIRNVIMKRVGKPEEIAEVIAFLSSDCSSYMTGQIVRVDGGM